MRVQTIFLSLGYLGLQFGLIYPEGKIPLRTAAIIAENTDATEIARSDLNLHQMRSPTAFAVFSDQGTQVFEREIEMGAMADPRLQ